MIKKISIITISWLLVLATMAMITNFSKEDVTASTQTSQGVVKDVLDVVLPEEEVTPEKIEEYHPTVRTFAHFGIFMLLGFCLSNAFRASLKIKLIFSYASSLAISVLYAIFDEIYQGYTGRASEAKDVLIDSLGALIGVLFFALFFYIYNKIISRKNKNPS